MTTLPTDQFKAATWNVHHATPVEELEPILRALLADEVGLFLVQEASSKPVREMFRAAGLETAFHPRQYLIAWSPAWTKVDAGDLRLSEQVYWRRGGDNRQWTEAVWAILEDGAGLAVRGTPGLGLVGQRAVVRGIARLGPVLPGQRGDPGLHRVAQLGGGVAQLADGQQPADGQAHRADRGQRRLAEGGDPAQAAGDRGGRAGGQLPLPAVHLGLQQQQPVQGPQVAGGVEGVLGAVLVPRGDVELLLGEGLQLDVAADVGVDAVAWSG